MQLARRLFRVFANMSELLCFSRKRVVVQSRELGRGPLGAAADKHQTPLDCDSGGRNEVVGGLIAQLKSSFLVARERDKPARQLSGSARDVETA